MTAGKLTQKQEHFCLTYFECGNASQAYRQSYDASRMKSETVNREAKKLMDNPKIATRLEELRAPVTKAVRITLESHLNMLATLRDEARNLGQVAAAVNAESLRGKASGLYVDKREISGPGGGPVELSASRVDLSRLDDVELEQYAALAEKIR